MTIKPGQAWGEAGRLAAEAPVAADDAAAARVLQDRWDALSRDTHEDRWSAGPGALGEVGLLSGDLHRTLGAPAHTEADLREGDAMRFPVDVGVVQFDGEERVFVSHLVAHERRRPRWFSGRSVAVMNGTFVDDLDLGPRAHPNDGRLDVTDGALPRGERRQGRRRARTGSHLPHPALTTRRIAEWDLQAEDDRPLHLWLDGVHVGTTTSAHIRCLPDAAVVVV